MTDIAPDFIYAEVRCRDRVYYLQEANIPLTKDSGHYSKYFPWKSQKICGPVYFTDMPPEDLEAIINYKYDAVRYPLPYHLITICVAIWGEFNDWCHTIFATVEQGKPHPIVIYENAIDYLNNHENHTKKIDKWTIILESTKGDSYTTISMKELKIVMNFNKLTKIEIHADEYTIKYWGKLLTIADQLNKAKCTHCNKTST